MSKKKIEALKGFAAAALAALVAARVIDPGLSEAITGVVVALLGLYAAFAVVPPKRVSTSRNDSPGGSL